jgi:predicted MPP superfamily phosphohydrolase
MLLNEHKALAGDRLVVAGVTDRAAALRNFEMPDVKKALDGAPAGAYRILLAHQPAVAQELSEGQADLQISGHTHGGMMPVLDVLLRPFNGGFVAGYYHRDKRPDVLVTNGAGIWNGFPCRLGVPAEIVLLHLKRL